MTLFAYAGTLATGLAVTLSVSGASFVVAVALGVLSACGSLAHSRTVRGIVAFYAATVRGVPEYLSMLLLYLGGQHVTDQVRLFLGLGNADIDPFAAAVISLGIVFGAYMGEAIRGAWLSVPRAQIDAAAVSGMSRARLLWRIALPQILFHGAGAFVSTWLVLLKTTPIAALIGLQDMFRRAQAAASATQRPLTFYLAVSVAFLCITALSEAAGHLITKRVEARMTA